MQAKFELLTGKCHIKTPIFSERLVSLVFKTLYGLICDTFRLLRYSDICGYLKHFHDLLDLYSPETLASDQKFIQDSKNHINEAKF